MLYSYQLLARMTLSSYFTSYAHYLSKYNFNQQNSGDDKIIFKLKIDNLAANPPTLYMILPKHFCFPLINLVLSISASNKSACFTRRERYIYIYFIFLPIFCDFKNSIFRSHPVIQKSTAYKRFPKRRSRKDFLYHSVLHWSKKKIQAFRLRSISAAPPNWMIYSKPTTHEKANSFVQAI